jgi:ABC-type uncharacterized transport system substrate-binding protein
LKGAGPADTRAQQRTGFELVSNQRTAQAMGIDIRQFILVRADEVIE